MFDNDAFLEVLGARIEYLVRHEKRAYKQYSDIHGYFNESMEDKIEGLEELPFPLPSESKVTWLNEELEEVNIGSQETS